MLHRISYGWTANLGTSLFWVSYLYGWLPPMLHFEATLLWTSGLKGLLIDHIIGTGALLR